MTSPMLETDKPKTALLESYFERIGYTGAVTNTFEVFQALHKAHVYAIPFENLDILLGKTIETNIPTLFEKLIVQRRGGYCFETNALFAYVLTQLGFDIEYLQGRVWFGEAYPAPSPEKIPFRSHQMTLVKFGGHSWLADVGFGGMGPIVPLKFVPDEEQKWGPDNFRILTDPLFGYMLQSHNGTEWINLYSFDLTPVFPVDYELGNYYICRSPKTWFTQLPVCVCPHAEGRSSLRGANFKQTDLQGRSTERQINTVSEYHEILKEIFQLNFSLDEATRLISPHLGRVNN